MRENWTKEQTVIALYTYCLVPFNKATNNNSEIISTAKLIGRSTNSVKMKIGNFGSFDPKLRERGISGLSGTSKLDREVWNEYYNHWDKLAYDANLLISKLKNQSVEKMLDLDSLNIPEGREKEVLVKQRVNQVFFRRAILAAYNYQCCISGLSVIELLDSCHIVGWSQDESNRTNPANGLCLNTLFHKAYDKNLLGITPDYEIKISEKMQELAATDAGIAQMFIPYNSRKMIMPEKFQPDRNLLDLKFQQFNK